MFRKNSRYAQTAGFSGEGAAVFDGIRPRTIGAATGVLEHTVREGDRLDLLARHYYNDDRLWWRIVDANPEFLNGADVVLEDMAGEVILIPKARE
ncbi:MAG: hypothetical protein SVU69_11750 [Pseudomonadota bacterium]|nr:hypothetical protein [Pseudomonadota bacterium]